MGCGRPSVMDLTILAIRYDDDAEGMNIETQIMHKIYLESHKQWTPHVGKVPHFRPNGFVARTRGVFGGRSKIRKLCMHNAPDGIGRSVRARNCSHRSIATLAWYRRSLRDITISR